MGNSRDSILRLSVLDPSNAESTSAAVSFPGSVLFHLSTLFNREHSVDRLNCRLSCSQPLETGPCSAGVAAISSADGDSKGALKVLHEHMETSVKSLSCPED